MLLQSVSTLYKTRPTKRAPRSHFTLRVRKRRGPGRTAGQVGFATLVRRDLRKLLGHVIKNPAIGRTSEDQITVADLTGVAIQDIQIAKMVVRALRENQKQAR